MKMSTNEYSTCKLIRAADNYDSYIIIVKIMDVMYTISTVISQYTDCCILLIIIM